MRGLVVVVPEVVLVLSRCWFQEEGKMGLLLEQK